MENVKNNIFSHDVHVKDEKVRITGQTIQNKVMIDVMRDGNIMYHI